MSQLRCLTGRAVRALVAAGLLVAAKPAVAQPTRPPGAPADVQYFHQPCPEAPGLQLQGGAAPDQNSQPAPQRLQEEMVVPAVEKMRRLSRTYALPAAKPYALDTRYGRVQVNVWNRPEVRTDVDIITRADSDDKAQQLQDMIQVQWLETDPATGGVAVRTRFGAMPRECWSRTKLYEVNYTVWVPAYAALKVYNTFGDVSIAGDLTGSTELAVEYGTLRTGRLDGPQNLVRVGNGEGSIPYARRASIDASYSRLRLDQGQTVSLRNNASDIDVGTVQDLTVHSKYGDVALGTVRNLRGSSGYTKFSIDKLSDRLAMKVDFCPSFEVRNTGSNFREITLDGGYSTILLNFADDAGFNFDVNTQHGKLLVDKRWVKVNSEESSPASSDMQGTFGLARTRRPAAGNVNIRVKYGDVRFNR